jgi:hypothetical protein
MDIVVSPSHETLFGAGDGYFLRLRDTAILGIATALFLALTTYFLSLLIRRFARCPWKHVGQTAALSASAARRRFPLSTPCLAR